MRKKPRLATIVFTLMLCLGLGSRNLMADDSSPVASNGSDPLLLTTDISLDFEYTYRSADELVEPYAIQSGIDITRDYLDQSPFATLSWNFGRKEGFSVAIGAQFRREFNPSVDGGYFTPTNWPVIGGPSTPIAFDFHFLTLGVLRWNSPNLAIEIGRDKPDYGSELEGTILPSARLPFLDAFRFRDDLGPLRIDWMIATLQEVRSWQTNGDPSSPYDVDPNEGLGGPEYYGFYNDTNPSTVIEALHHFSWNFGNLVLGAGDNIVYARRNNYFLITDFLPVVSWHQTQSLSNAITVLIDAVWRPAEGLTIACNLGLSAFNPSFLGISDTSVPTNPACVLGAHYDVPTQAGPLSTYLEMGYTGTIWGNFSGVGNSPGDVDPLAREQYRLMMDSGAALIPLTSPYGPGATWLSAKASIAIIGTTLKVGTNILVLSKNTIANLIDTPYDSTADDGPRELFISAAFPISYRIGPFEFYTAPTLCARDSTVWYEQTIGGKYVFHRDTKIGD